MAVLLIAGSGRGAGKTAVGCALISAMPVLQWIAVKVTPHVHEPGAGIWEETDRGSDKDTGRYLAAGAARAFLIQDSLDHDPLDWIAQIRQSHAKQASILIESNRVAPLNVALHGERTICLAVLSGPEAEWKPSLRERAICADALVLTGGLTREQLPLGFDQIPYFQMQHGQWLTSDLLDFVRDNCC